VTKPIRLAVQARAEILAPAAWYDDRRENLGEEFVAAVQEALERVATLGPDCRPAIGVPKQLGVRRVLVRRFPYVVVFIELPDVVRVLAVAHGRQKPGYWRKRI
jgi:toxin ParE1/3/4